MKLTIYSFIYLFFFASISLTGQVLNSKEIEKGTGIKRNALYNLEEIKVRWKKAALENCPGVPCVTSTVPGAPTNVVATTGNTTANVAFTAPTNNGGSVITGYTVTSNPGGITATGATSPINVTGLTNGTAYTFTVVATNAVGNSVASAASTAVTPVAPNTVPGAPTNVVATTGNTTANVAFTAPTNNGGSVITGYTVTSNPGNITATGATSPINVTGLTNGTAYTFTVVATNAVGNSVASAASTAVTPVAPNTVPGAPTAVVATAGNASASVVFVAPTNNGGSAITGYTVTSNPGNITATGATSPINVTGLTNGTAYTFTVVSTNAIGNSIASAASTAVTPQLPAFVCGTVVTDIDLNPYNTVLIGTQCWFKENLKVTRYNDLTAIPLDATGGSTGTSSTWQNLRTGSYTIYGNESSTSANATNYGFLYNWYAAKGIITSGGTPTKNICPTGWHVPTDAEWTIMIQQLDNTASATTVGVQSSTAGTLLKKNDVLWIINTGTNTSGFSVLPGGYRFSVGSFFDIRSFAFFWSATEIGNVSDAWFRVLDASNGLVYRSDVDKSVGASVRCLRD